MIILSLYLLGLTEGEYNVKLFKKPKKNSVMQQFVNNLVV